MAVLTSRCISSLIKLLLLLLMSQRDMPPPLNYRALDEQDIESVLCIERQSYEFPWSKKIIEDCLKNSYQSDAILFNGELIGYYIVSKVLDEAHLLNICLDVQWQGKKLGQVVLFHLIASLKQQKITRLFLEVRPSNFAALTIYNKLNFKKLGLRKNYYRSAQGREDALTMMKLL